MDYMKEWVEICAMKNYLNIDILTKKENYRFTEKDIENHVENGIVMHSDFTELNKGYNLVEKLLNTKIILKKNDNKIDRLWINY